MILKAEILKEPEKAAGNGEAKPVVIPRNAYQAREFSNNDWDLAVPNGITAAELGNAALYVNAPSHAPGMRSFDVIRAHGDGFWAEVLVRQAVSGDVLQVQVLRVVPITPTLDEDHDRILRDYDFKHNDKEGWIVTRKADGVCMGTGREKGWFKKEDAVRYVKDHASVARRQVVYT